MSPTLTIQPVVRYGLEGKVVTLNDAFEVLAAGVVYVAGNRIVAVRPTAAAPPPGFEAAPIIRTGGTIFPGMLELHNHLSYNILPRWQVPRRFTNRSQWARIPEYRQFVRTPMVILGRTPGYVEAIVRYVEAKCLVAGVTTSQGISLSSNQGIRRYYRGIVRNVEDTQDDPELPEARTRIADVDARDADRFLRRLQESTCLLLHLSEGVDARARDHFRALHLADGRWAITPALAGIHSLALTPSDYAIMAEHGAAVVWSPLSNLLLYGQTLDLRAVKEAGVRMALGADWSVTGSKSLLHELKVAKAVNAVQGDVFSDRELVAMVTRFAADIVRWGKALGSIEAGKRADLIVVNGRAGDPYARLLNARETSLTLVIIDGVARYGQPRLMRRLGPISEELRVGRSRRALNLDQAETDPLVRELTLSEARDRLADGMRRLPELAKKREAMPPAFDLAREVWTIELDHDGLFDESQRHHLPLPETGEPTGEVDDLAGLLAFEAAVPYSQLAHPMTLDPLTVADDARYIPLLLAQSNLPDAIKAQLAF
ncbi:MAG TPA: amidohydrolase [Anaerolineae bacterium]|nr:amidohydrolase [Anaerolineae bacterium]